MAMITRREGESEFEFFKRIIRGKLVDKTITEDWEDLSELLFGEGNCFNSSEVRKRAYGANRAIDLIEKEGVDKLLAERNEILDELTLKKQEIQKERVKMQDVKNALSATLRSEARHEAVVEAIKEVVEKLPPLDVVEPRFIQSGNKSGVLCLADIHFGKEFALYGLNGEVVNQYNPEIVYQRLWQVRDYVLEICEKEGLDTIDIIELGDTIQGILRMNDLNKVKYGVIDGAIEIARFLATWLNEISKFVNIRFTKISGNHEEVRPLNSRKGELEEENISKIILEIIQVSLANNPNITFTKNLMSDIALVNIANFNIVATHEINRDRFKAIKNLEEQYNCNIDYLISAHEHYSNIQNVATGKEVIGVRSLVGTDDYSRKIQKTADAGALFVIFKEGYGKYITYDILV